MSDFGYQPINNELVEDNIIPNGISFRLGNKIARFTFVEDETITLEDEIKNEYITQYKTKINELNQELETRTSQLKLMYDKKNSQIEQLKLELSKQLSNANLMPDINYDHFRQGLSIVKDHPEYAGSLVWIYRGEYHVKYLNQSRIEPSYSIKKLNKQVLIELVTDGFNVMSVKVLNVDGSKFVHYHSFSHGADCWGSWSYNNKLIKTPDDAIETCKSALDVLSVINELSIANRTPRGLPRIPTIQRNLLIEQTVNETEQVNETQPDAPVRPQPRRNVWTT